MTTDTPNDKDPMPFVDNPAHRIGEASPDCDVCEEALLFAMRDNYHEFSITLSTVLECLRAAEQAGEVPPLPNDWWHQVQRRFLSLGLP